MASGPRVALVTGGASGMGLGVVEDLVQKGWNVAIVDIDARMSHSAEERLGNQILFIRSNVADYDQQAEAFSRTWAQWGRLDLVLANAGILDRMDITAPGKEMANGAPAKPDTLSIDICLYGVIYAAYLGLHYFRKNSNGRGNLIFTSSQGGIYPVAMAPLYGAAKTGVVGFTRSLAQRIKDLGQPITVNCILPGLVPTPLANTALLAAFPQEMITPVSTIIRAVNGFIEDQSLTGQAAECSALEIHFRPVLPYSNAAAEFMSAGKFAALVDMRAAMEDVEKKAKEFEEKMADGSV